MVLLPGAKMAVTNSNSDVSGGRGCVLTSRKVGSQESFPGRWRGIERWNFSICVLTKIPSSQCILNCSITFSISLTKQKFKLLNILKNGKTFLSSWPSTTTLIICPESKFHLERNIYFIFTRQYSIVVKSTGFESDCQTWRSTSLAF